MLITKRSSKQITDTNQFRHRLCQVHHHCSLPHNNTSLIGSLITWRHTCFSQSLFSECQTCTDIRCLFVLMVKRGVAMSKLKGEVICIPLISQIDSHCLHYAQRSCSFTKIAQSLHSVLC